MTLKYSKNVITKMRPIFLQKLLFYKIQEKGGCWSECRLEGDRKEEVKILEAESTLRQSTSLYNWGLTAAAENVLSNFNWVRRIEHDSGL